MAVRKYLDNTGLAEVANHVNTRLKTVTTMPVTADEGAVRLYTGETSGTFIKGHIYQMKATAEQYLQFSADESTYFMTEDGTITDVAPASYSPQIENVSFTDESTGATLVYMAGNNALVQKLGNDVNVITVNFNKIKTSVMPWWTAGAATGSYNPFTIRNVKLVSATAWVDITPSGSIVSVAVTSKSALTSEWQGMTEDSTAIVNATASFALNDTYNIPTGRHLLLKGGDSDKSTFWTNDGKKFNAQYITDDLVFTELNDEQTLKYDTLPDAQTIGEGKIALYNGPTTQDLIHGHFYETKGESGTIYVPTTDTEPQVSEYGFYDGSEHWITFASETPAIGDTVLSSDDSSLIGLEITATENDTVTVNDVVFTKNPDYDKFIQYYADANGTPYTEPLTHSSNPQELGLYLPSSGTIYHWEECNYGAKDASALNYDNTESGLEATNVQGAIDECQPKIKQYASTTDAQTAFENGELAPEELFSTIDTSPVSPLDVTGVVSEGNNNAVTSNGVFNAFKDIKWIDNLSNVDILDEAVSKISDTDNNLFATFIVTSSSANAPNDTSTKFGIMAWGIENNLDFCKVLAIDFDTNMLYSNTLNTTWSGWEAVGKDYDSAIVDIEDEITAANTAITNFKKEYDLHVSDNYSYPHFIPTPFRHGINEKVYLFGDSITVGSVTDEGTSYMSTPSPWGVCFSAYLTGDMSHYSMKAFGGKPFHQTSAGDGSITSDILATDLTDYKTIVIQGGANDNVTATELEVDMDKVANYINTNYSGKNVIFCGTVYCFTDSQEARMQTYRKSFRDKAIYYHGTNNNNYYFINNEMLLNHTDQYEGLWVDIVHPSMPGSIVLGTNFYKVLTGNECDGIAGCITWSGKYMTKKKWPILRYSDNISLLSAGSHTCKLAKSFVNIFHTDVTTQFGIGNVGSSGSISETSKSTLSGNVFNGNINLENVSGQSCEMDFCVTATDPELQVTPTWS